MQSVHTPHAYDNHLVFEARVFSFKFKLYLMLMIRRGSSSLSVAL